MTARCLIIAHGHPELSAGGAERAAYAEFDQFRRGGKIIPLFVARAEPKQIGHSAPFRTMLGRADEILASPPSVDTLTLLSHDPRRLGELLDELVRLHAPTVAHVQHFAFWGVDVIDLLRRRGLRVILTLHEFLLMCHRDGQMLTTQQRLCRNAAPIACANCFPDISAGQFFVRKKIILKHMANVDSFIAPSEFLAERFISWGIDAAKVHVIDNPLDQQQIDQAIELAESRISSSSESMPRIKLGYFGQITPYKGLGVLLKAVEIVDHNHKGVVSLVINGAMAPGLSNATREEIEASLRRLRHVIEWRGPYDPSETLSLMRQVDTVVVPSIWWENSPVVIQEARLAMRPVLCSDIGGMREKAVGVEGSRLFRTGSAQDLAAQILAIIDSEAELSVETRLKKERERLNAGLKVHRQALTALTQLVASPSPSSSKKGLYDPPPRNWTV